jgi:hypothetical protein
MCSILNAELGDTREILGLNATSIGNAPYLRGTAVVLVTSGSRTLNPQRQSSPRVRSAHLDLAPNAWAISHLTRSPNIVSFNCVGIPSQKIQPCLSLRPKVATQREQHVDAAVAMAGLVIQLCSPVPLLFRIKQQASLSRSDKKIHSIRR